MPLEAHILQDEEPVAFCETEQWRWLCTDRRLLKYRSDSTAEELHDLSLDEISAISMVHTGPDSRLRNYGLIALLFGLFTTVAGMGTTYLLLIMGIPTTGLGAYFIYRWLHSERSFFEFRGSGIIRDEREAWRIDEASTDSDEVRAFVRAVRAQLGAAAGS